MIEVTAGIIFNGESILVARRAAGKHLAGYWEFPGGKLEAGETPEACLLREIREELDITIRIDSFLADNEYHYSDKHILLKAYLCTYVSGTIRLKDHDEVRWVNKKDLALFELAPADVPFIDLLPA